MDACRLLAVPAPSFHHVYVETVGLTALLIGAQFSPGGTWPLDLPSFEPLMRFGEGRRKFVRHFGEREQCCLLHAARHEVGAQVRIVQLEYGVTHIRGVVLIDIDRRVAHHLGQRRIAADDGRRAAGHRLKGRHAKALVFRGEQQRVGAGVAGAKLRVVESQTPNVESGRKLSQLRLDLPAPANADQHQRSCHRAVRPRRGRPGRRSCSRHSQDALLPLRHSACVAGRAHCGSGRTRQRSGA